MKAHYVLSGMTAIVVFFAIGCADGQRSNKGGKGKQILKTQGQGGRTTPSKTEGDKSASGTTLPTAGDSAKQKTIDDTIAQLEAGAPPQDFKNGTYQLVSTSTVFSLPLPSDFLQAVNTTTYAPERNFAPTPGTTVAVGLLSTKITQPTRAIAVPTEFTISAGGTGEPIFRAAAEQVLTSTVNLKVSVVSIDETLAPGAAPKIGLIAFLNSEGNIEDGAGVSASFDARAVDNGDVRFIIKIEEKLPAPVSSSVFRNFFLTYRPKADAKKDAPKAMTPEEANIAVVTGNH